MKSVILYIAIFVFASGVVGVSGAIAVTASFDDIGSPDNFYYIPEDGSSEHHHEYPYYGLFWRVTNTDNGEDARVMKRSFYTSTYGCGASYPSGDYAAYVEGAVSPTKAAILEITIDHGTFKFVNAYFCKFCTYAMNPLGADYVDLEGYQPGDGGTPTYSQRFYLTNDTFVQGDSDGGTPGNQDFNWTGLDKLVLDGRGNDSLERLWLMDNFEFNFESGNSPTAYTYSATDVETKSATLNGLVNGKNQSTAVSFEYGPDIGYGSTVTADQSPTSGLLSTEVSKTVTGLSHNKTYHYRVVATNSDGTAYGEDETFTTSKAPAQTGSTLLLMEED